MIVVYGYESKLFSISSGVPQGLTLSQFLFVMHINDVNNFIRNEDFIIYADDLKIFKQIGSEDDYKLPQNDLDSLHSCCVQNKL